MSSLSGVFVSASTNSPQNHAAYQLFGTTENQTTMGREWENDESLLWANHHGIQIFHPQICRLKLRIITNDEQLIHHPHPQTTDWRMVTSLPPWVTRVTRVDPQVPVLFCMVGIRKGVETNR